MARPTSGALPLARTEPRTRTALLLEAIALRHQIAVLERSGTRRPCFRLWDRLFWILFSRWWSQWRDGLIIVQAETVLRWRREGWSALWRYRSRGRWRGGRPRVSSEVRQLIAQVARENSREALADLRKLYGLNAPKSGDGFDQTPVEYKVEWSGEEGE